MRKQHVLLVTSGQPSANPRVVKEAISLTGAGYDVTVVYVPISPWADSFDTSLFQEYPDIKFIKVGYHPQQQEWFYKWARVRRKFIASVFHSLGDIFKSADYSTILFGQELLKEVKRHKADLYVAHNLGALPVAVKVAEMYGAKVGFDAEDFHRGEFKEGSLEEQQACFLENKYFPYLNYLSVASPLIAQAYKKLFPSIDPIVFNNVFPVQELNQALVKSKSPTLKLFWFSQTIGRGRGLENIIEAMGVCKDIPLSLTLLGNTTQEVEQYLLSIASRASLNSESIKFISPVSEDELFQIASGFDIGIGSEVGHCLNRQYCLTNKVFTYLMAGNALVLSDTKAQKEFLEEHASIGFLYKSEDPSSLASVLRQYWKTPNLLLQHQKNARSLAVKVLNWEIESKKFLNNIKFILS